VPPVSADVERPHSLSVSSGRSADEAGLFADADRAAALPVPPSLSLAQRTSQGGARTGRANGRARARVTQTLSPSSSHSLRNAHLRARLGIPESEARDVFAIYLRWMGMRRAENGRRRRRSLRAEVGSVGSFRSCGSVVGSEVGDWSGEMNGCLGGMGSMARNGIMSAREDLMFVGSQFEGY